MSNARNDASQAQVAASAGLDEEDQGVPMDVVLADLLRVEPVAFAGMVGWKPSHPGSLPPDGALASALNVMTRRVLAHAIAIRDEEGATVSLKTPETARANGWPDEKIANVATMLVWALIDDDRYLMGLPSIPLIAAGSSPNEPLDPVSSTRGLEGLPPAEKLLSWFSRMIDVPADLAARRKRDLKRPFTAGVPVASTSDAIREILGLDPVALAGLLPLPREVAKVDPDRDARAGLHRLLRRAMDQRDTMKSREVEAVRLMTEADAHEYGCPDARTANFGTFFSVGLLAEGEVEPHFVRARAHPPERDAMLRKVAEFVYFYGTDQTYDAFVALSDDNVFFGAGYRRSKADRLLAEVAEELDPSGSRRADLPYWIRLRLTKLG